MGLAATSLVLETQVRWALFYKCVIPGLWESGITFRSHPGQFSHLVRPGLKNKQKVKNRMRRKLSVKVLGYWETKTNLRLDVTPHVCKLERERGRERERERETTID